MKILNEYLRTFTSLNNKCKLFLYLFFIRSFSAGIIYYIAIYLSHINLKANVIGYEISSLILGNLLGSLLVSQVLNNNNTFKLAGYGLFIQGLCFLIISLFSSTYLLALAVFSIGFFGYIYKISSDFLITSLSGEDKNSRSKAITLMSVFSNLGLGLGGASVGLISENNAKFLFLGTGILLLVASMPYFKNNSQLSEIINNNSNDNELPNSNLFILSLISILVMGMIFAQQRIGFGIFLNNHFSGSGMSAIILLNSAMIILVLPILRPYLVQHSSVITMGVGVLLLGGGMFFLKYITNFYFVPFLCIVWTLGEMISSTISHLMCFQFSEKNKRGQAMGAYKFLYALGTLVGALIGARILKYSSLDNIWLLCGFLGFFVFFLSLLITSFKKSFNPSLSPRSL